MPIRLEAFLNAAGTDQDHRGLWRSVEHLQLPAENGASTARESK
ncbi:MAG: hypothetical protein R3B96_06100 [Pirellulaceae bacterium]